MFAKYREPKITAEEVITVLDILLARAFPDYSVLNGVMAHCFLYCSQRQANILKNFLANANINYSTNPAKTTIWINLSKNTLIDRLEKAFAEKYPEYQAEIKSFQPKA